MGHRLGPAFLLAQAFVSTEVQAAVRSVEAAVPHVSGRAGRLEFDDIVLRAQGSRSWYDFRQPDIGQSQYIRDAWARDTARDMGKLEGHATFVHLYLNGLYWGLYNPVERTNEAFAEAYLGRRRRRLRRDQQTIGAGDARHFRQHAGVERDDGHRRRGSRFGTKPTPRFSSTWMSMTLSTTC